MENSSVIDKLKTAKTSDELASLIVSLVKSDTDLNLQESVKLNKLYKYILPFLLGVYSKDFIYDAFEKVENLLSKDTSPAQVIHSESDQVNIAVEKYTKLYDVKEGVIRNMLRKETSFSAMNKKYDANVVGDLDNTLGPSYGPGQIKLSTAQEIYQKKPEKTIDPKSITKEMLTNDIDFNIRTMCKIVRYYYDKFGKVKNNNKRWAMAATAYNRGINKAMKSNKPNKYGNFATLSIKDKQKSLFREYISVMDGGIIKDGEPEVDKEKPIKDQLYNILEALPKEDFLDKLMSYVDILKNSSEFMNFESPSVDVSIKKISEDVEDVKLKLRNISSNIFNVLNNVKIKL